MVTNMEKHTRLIVSFLLTFLLFAMEGQSQTEWELEKEEDGISAYTRKRDGIKFKEYKVEMIIEATHEQILAVFQDFDRYPEIFPGTSDVKLLLDTEDRYVTYVKFNIPFPVRDRDALFDNRITYDASKDLLRVDVQCLTDEFETDDSLIQITFCDGYWEFQELGDGKMRAVNQLIVDPGGFAPAFIVNSKTIDDPIETCQSLRKIVNEQKYSGHSFTLLEK